MSWCHGDSGILGPGIYMRLFNGKVVILKKKLLKFVLNIATWK
jgi:hypothetical protein